MPEGIGNIGQWAGVNSGVDPESLPTNVLWQGMNIITRGGLIRTRPGFKSIYNGPSGWSQGCTFFQSSDGIDYFVFAVNGYVYASPYPFTEYIPLIGVRFSTKALHVVFEKCEQTTSYDDDGTFVFLPKPKNILIMQDGESKAAYFDGSVARHLNPEKSGGTVTEPLKDETPAGLWMAWANDRLWVFRGNQGLASDIGNPLKFTETQYLSEARAFLFPGDVTGAVQPYAGSPLVVFTSNTMTQLQCQIRDRTQWATTTNFQQTEDGIGCVAGKSIVKSFGQTWWFSEYGVTNMDFALQTFNASKFRYMDNQMAVSKAYLSPVLDRVCAAVYENYILFSVPSGHIYNRHTWVLDQMNTPEGRAAWDGHWTGIRPVEWATARIQGRQRIFGLSVDADGVNRIYEAFSPDRNDNGCSITCMIETGRYNEGNKNLKKYKSSRIFFDGLVGDSYISVRTAAEQGPYNEVMNHKFISSEGSVKDGYMDEFTDFVPQNRRVNSEYFTVDSEECNKCGVESDNPNDIGTAFSHWMVWSGELGIHGFQMMMDDGVLPSDYESGCLNDETGEKIVTAAGCTTLDRDDISDGTIQIFESTKTAEYECPGDPTQVGRATVRSVSTISQADADAKAFCASDAEAKAALGACGTLPGEEEFTPPDTSFPPVYIDPWNFHTIETSWTGNVGSSESLKLWYGVSSGSQSPDPGETLTDFSWLGAYSPYNPQTPWGGLDSGMADEQSEIITNPTTGDYHCVDLINEYVLHGFYFMFGVNQNPNGGDPPPTHGIHTIAMYTAPASARADGEKWDESAIPWVLNQTFDWSAEWNGQVNGAYLRIDQALAAPVTCRYIKFEIVDDWASNGDASNPIVRLDKQAFNVAILDASMNQIEYTRDRYECEISAFRAFGSEWCFEEITGLAGECHNDDTGTNQCHDAIDSGYADNYLTPNVQDNVPQMFQMETCEDPKLLSRLMFVGDWLDGSRQPTNFKIYYKRPDDVAWQYYRHFRFPNNMDFPFTYGPSGDDFMTGQQKLFGGSNNANKAFHIPLPQGWYSGIRIEVWADPTDPQYGTKQWFIASLYHANRWVIADGEDTSAPTVVDPTFNALGGYWKDLNGWTTKTTAGSRGFTGRSDGASAVGLFLDALPVLFATRTVRIQFDVDVITSGTAYFIYVETNAWSFAGAVAVGTYSNLVGVTESAQQIVITSTGSKSFDVILPAKTLNHQYPTFHFNEPNQDLEISNYRTTYLDV